ncbi:MAG TPA: alpha-ketoglutarate-dependent dioxygenase AlkB [Burkholderiales bacterium]|nr:alpha-ketoglutarate-dependent dioxygenase AlkB [Burkholderiales bacterium]
MILPNTGAVAQPDLFGATDLPAGLAYLADLITANEEASLLANIGRLPLAEARYKQYTAKRRILSFGAQYDFSSNELHPSAPLLGFLQPLREKVSAWRAIPAHEFAHALVTEYRPGTALGWHRDVPDFEGVVGVSLGTACRMRFRAYPPKPGRSMGGFELRLEPRSACVMQGAARWRWQHAIPPTPALRYSITFRTLARRIVSGSRSGHS